MCGIAGIVSWDEKFRISRELLLKMSAALAHRGPDGQDIFLNCENQPISLESPQVGFAFRRLAVLDPDPRSMQPFTIGRQTLVFNGEIYNFRELRAELAHLRPDYEWRTTGDAEVLLMSYAVWGDQCVQHLNGMFAFAVWDDEQKTLFLARDRMGQKPLYVALFGTESPAIAFASEIGALRKISWFARDCSEKLVEYLRYGHVGLCMTNMLLTFHAAPGSWVAIRRGLSEDSGSYFDLQWHDAIDTPSAIVWTRELLIRAVHRQLVSDVPLGVFLSGGIDSSVIAACARKLGPVQTFSVRFDDPRYDESKYAAAVAKHLKTKHHEFRVTPNAAEDLPKLAEVFGDPFGDSSALPTHYLSRETRKQIKVALSGDGGDELFGGYDRYRAIEVSHLVGRFVPAYLSRRVPFAGRHPKSTAARLGRFFNSLADPMPRRYASYLRIFNDPQLRDLLGPNVALDHDNVEDVFQLQRDAGAQPAEAALATDRVTYLPDDLLTKVDRCSMLHGLEVRCPFMDHDLVQFAAGLTSEQLLIGGAKRMLREAFEHDLPDFVFKRKKMGFAVPIGEWFRRELKPMLRDHLFASDSFAKQRFNVNAVEHLVDEHERMQVDHSQRLYALLMLELWWKIQRDP
jgi:asparagine synthase (glutamine-hydrolysing)